LPTLPPTATPEPTIAPTEETPEPTEASTEEPAAAEPTDAPAADAEGVMVNGILGDPASGEFWFTQFPNPGTGQARVTCHNPDEAITGLGPSLYGIADVAGDRIEGYSAEEYLLESIKDPRAFLAPSQLNPDGEEVEWNPELMPADWAQVLDETARQVAFRGLSTGTSQGSASRSCWRSTRG
jgi:hypothetical protein